MAEPCRRPAVRASATEVRAALAAQPQMTEEETAAATQLTWELQDRDQARLQGLDTTAIQARIADICSS